MTAMQHRKIQKATLEVVGWLGSAGFLTVLHPAAPKSAMKPPIRGNNREALPAKRGLKRRRLSGAAGC